MSRAKAIVVGVKAIAATYWQLHLQHPSAWTQERAMKIAAFASTVPQL
jgi:hypothetical protein